MFTYALFHRPGEPLSLERQSIPSLASGEALVRITCCTLCSSDLHTYTGRRSGPAPSILGHESVGVIERVSGPWHDHTGAPLQAGDRVTWSIAVSCGVCRLCLAGILQKCLTLFKYGHERHTAGGKPSGGLSEYCVLRPGTAVFRVPAEVPDFVAAVSTCAAATVFAALRDVGDVRGANVLIQGAGTLGLIATAACHAQGARVLVSDPNPVRLQLALRFGATHLLDPGLPLASQVHHLTAGHGVDAAVELSGSPDAAEAALPALGVGGRYVLAGAVFPSRPASLDMETLVRRMIRISGMHNYAPGDLQAALDFVAQQSSTYPFASLISAQFALSAVEDAFRFATSSGSLRTAVLP